MLIKKKKKNIWYFQTVAWDFSQKKRKEKHFLSKDFIQDKLEINEQKIRFFSKKKLLKFSRSCVGFFKKNF